MLRTATALRSLIPLAVAWVGGTVHAPLGAQGPGVPLPLPAHDATIVWPWPIGADGFQRVVATDVNGDLRTDLLALADQRVAVVNAPAVLPDFLEVLFPAQWVPNDIAAIPGDTPSGLATLLVAGTDGVRAGFYDANTNTVVHGVVLGGAWVGAQRVVWGVEGADQMIGGIDATGQTLLIGRRSGGGFTHVLAVTAPSTIRDVVVVDWDGGGPARFAVLTASDGLLLYQQDGTSTFLGIASGTGFIARLDDALPHDKLVWLAELAGSWWLTVIDKDGREPTVFLEFNVFEPIGIACADVDYNRTVDALITQTASTDAYLMVRSGPPQDPGAHRFAADVYAAIDVGQPAACPASFSDYDRDLRADVCVGLDAGGPSGEGAIRLNTGLTEGLVDGASGGSFDDGILGDTLNYYYPNPQGGRIDVRIDVEGYENMNHVQMREYRGHFDENLNDWVLVEGHEDDRLYPFGSHAGSSSRHMVLVQMDTVPPDDDVWDGTHVFIEARVVDFDGIEIVKASPSFWLGLTLRTVDRPNPYGTNGYMFWLRQLDNRYPDDRRVRNGGRDRVGGIVEPWTPPPIPLPGGAGHATPPPFGPPTQNW